MCEKIKKFWDESEILAVKAWYESEKGFQQIDKENNFPDGTLFELVNSIQDYKGTRHSIGRWIRRMCKPSPAVPPQSPVIPKQRKPRRKKMTKKDSLQDKEYNQDKIERQLQRELNEALKKIARLEAQQEKDHLRREFLEGQIAEYKKLVKPSQSKKSHTK